jgi:hypothetical protein
MISEALVLGSKSRRCLLTNSMRTWTRNSGTDDFIWRFGRTRRSICADLCHFILKPTRCRALIISQVVLGIYTIDDIDLYVAATGSGHPHTAIRFNCPTISIDRGSLFELGLSTICRHLNRNCSKFASVCRIEGDPLNEFETEYSAVGSSPLGCLNINRRTLCYGFCSTGHVQGAAP